MKKSIVNQLAHWLATRRAKLDQAGVEIDARLPRSSTNDFPWKAGITLVKDDILVMFTVWERTVYETELMIEDGLARKTLRYKEATPQRPEEIRPTLDAVMDELIAGTYRRH